jgi:hypothetical protein
MVILPPEQTQIVPQTADPNGHIFCRDKNERRNGDCMLDSLIAVAVTLLWRYPKEFTPQWYPPGNAKEVRKWYQQPLRQKTLPALAEQDEIQVWIRVKDNFERILPSLHIKVLRHGTRHAWNTWHMTRETLRNVCGSTPRCTLSC